MEKGKLKIAKIEDNTAAAADILIHLNAGQDVEKTCNALYAFTECQVSISPKAVVIVDKKPVFMGVSEILKRNVADTKETLRRELEVQLAELQEAWMQASLEKIFIENRIYKVLEESESWEQSLTEIEERLQPFVKTLSALSPRTTSSVSRKSASRRLPSTKSTRRRSTLRGWRRRLSSATRILPSSRATPSSGLRGCVRSTARHGRAARKSPPLTP